MDMNKQVGRPCGNGCAGHLSSLLFALSLLLTTNVESADQRQDPSATRSGQTSSTARSASGSRVISTKPSGNNGVKTRVLTRDGRVRDVVVKDNSDR